MNTYPGLLAEGLPASPDRTSDGELAEKARSVLDGFYASQVAAARELFQNRLGQSRATTELQTAARAATSGAIELLLVDMDDTMPGTVDADGFVTHAPVAGASSYGVLDEIAGRALLAGAKVLAVRRADMPGGAALAAILRYPV